MSEPAFGDDADEILSVDHYTGADPCHYQCGRPAAFVVVARHGTREATFAGCRECLNRAAIRPIENGWVDAFEGGVELR